MPFRLFERGLSLIFGCRSALARGEPHDNPLRMKTIAFASCLAFILTGFSLRPTLSDDDRVRFVCMKRQMSTKTCHYNFIIDGAKYRYVDMGCKFRDRSEVIDRARSGRIALAREWKIECPGDNRSATNQNK